MCVIQPVDETSQYLTSKYEAEQHAMTEFFAVVPRISNLKTRAFQYRLRIEYLNTRIPQSGHNGNCRVRRTIGGGIDSRGNGSDGTAVAPGRFLTSNGTMHGQSNAVNSPASSVQNPSASAQQPEHVQPVQKQKADKNTKTICSMDCFFQSGQSLNLDAKIRKQAERELTADQINRFKEECTPDLAARSFASQSKYPTTYYTESHYF